MEHPYTTLEGDSFYSSKIASALLIVQKPFIVGMHSCVFDLILFRNKVSLTDLVLLIQGYQDARKQTLLHLLSRKDFKEFHGIWFAVEAIRAHEPHIQTSSHECLREKPVLRG